MYLEWNPNIIDLSNLERMSYGDEDMVHRYLQQFLEILPNRIEKLQVALAQKDRKMIRQIIHKMSPQLQFFGIPNVFDIIRKIETEYQEIPIDQLDQLVNRLIDQLNAAMSEVKRLID